MGACGWTPWGVLKKKMLQASAEKGHQLPQSCAVARARASASVCVCVCVCVCVVYLVQPFMSNKIGTASKDSQALRRRTYQLEMVLTCKIVDEA